MSKFKDKFEVCKTKVKSAGKRVGGFVEEHPEGFLYGSFVGLMGLYLGLTYRNNKKSSKELVDGLLEKDNVEIGNYVDKRKGGINYLTPKDD